MSRENSTRPEDAPWPVSLDLQDTHVACRFDATLLHERGRLCWRCAKLRARGSPPGGHPPAFDDETES